jgi:hypothetical protein
VDALLEDAQAAAVDDTTAADFEASLRAMKEAAGDPYRRRLFIGGMFGSLSGMFGRFDFSKMDFSAISVCPVCASGLSNKCVTLPPLVCQKPSPQSPLVTVKVNRVCDKGSNAYMVKAEIKGSIEFKGAATAEASSPVGTTGMTVTVSAAVSGSGIEALPYTVVIHGTSSGITHATFNLDKPRYGPSATLTATVSISYVGFTAYYAQTYKYSGANCRKTKETGITFKIPNTPCGAGFSIPSVGPPASATSGGSAC